MTSRENDVGKKHVAAADVKIGIEDDSRYRGTATLKKCDIYIYTYLYIYTHIIFQSKLLVLRNNATTNKLCETNIFHTK